MATRVTVPKAVKDVQKPASVTKIHIDTQRFAHTQRELSQAQRARVVAVYLINYEFSEYFCIVQGVCRGEANCAKNVLCAYYVEKQALLTSTTTKKRNYTGIYLFFFSDTNRLLGFR